MAKPRSFRCRALFSLALAPKCERHGMGRGEEDALLGAREAGFGAAWAVLHGWGQDLACGVCRQVPAPMIRTDVQVWVGTHIFWDSGKGHRGREAAFLGGWDGGGVGWGGQAGTFPKGLVTGTGKSHQWPLLGPPVACLHSESKLYFLPSPPGKE